MNSSSSFETTDRFRNPADHSSFLTQFVNDPSKQGKESHGQSETAAARPSGRQHMNEKVYEGGRLFETRTSGKDSSRQQGLCNFGAKLQNINTINNSILKYILC